MGAELEKLIGVSEHANAFTGEYRLHRVIPELLFASSVEGTPAAAPPGLDFSLVRTLRLTADRVTAADVEAFRRNFPPDATLTVGFASTETGGVFGMRIGHDTTIAGPLVPMGRPLDGVEVRLLDDEGAEVAFGEPGEIVVSSPHVIKGYWNDPELTAAQFSDDLERPGSADFGLAISRVRVLMDFTTSSEGRMRG